MTAPRTPRHRPFGCVAWTSRPRPPANPRRASHRLALIRRGAVPDPAIRDAARATLADVRARGDAAVREANERVGGGRSDGRLARRAGRPPRRARRARPAHPPGARPGDRARDPLRGAATTDLDAHPDRARDRDRAPLEPTGQRRRVRPGRFRAVSELADHDRRPGPRRRRRAGRRRQPGRPRRRHEPRPARCRRDPRGRRVRRRRRRAGRRGARLWPAGCRPRAGRPSRRARATPG